MRLPWPHRRRGAVLAALALAAGAGRDLPGQLERLAAGDPLLRPWARRLVGDLRGGRPLAEVLRRHRLLSRGEAEHLSAAVERGIAAEALRDLSGVALDPPRGIVLAQWLPLWLGLALIGPALGLMLVVGTSFELFFSELGIRLPQLTEGLIRLHHQAGTALCAVLVIAAVCRLLIGVPGLPHLVPFWAWSEHRALLAARLVRHARAGSDRMDPPPSRWLRGLRLLPGFGGFRPTPRWLADRMQYALMTRGSPLARRDAAAGDLASFAAGRGLLVGAPGAVDWPRSIAEADAHLAAAMERSRAVAAPLLVLAAVLSATLVPLALLLPLIRIMAVLG